MSKNKSPDPEPPAIGSRWLKRLPLGEWDSGPVRVMAFAERWIMARRPKHLPFVVLITDWHERYEEFRDAS